VSYYQVLGLEREPFSTSPDPGFFYLSKDHKSALYRLRISVTLKRGLSVILGDVGTGKTTLSRKFCQVLREEKDVSFFMILNPYFKTQKQFLHKLVSLFHVDLPLRKATGLDCIEAVEQFLYRQGVEEQKNVVLLIDEAQLLSDEILEILRILLNYETNEYKILQLILVGQMELLPRLRRMNNFWDRIALRYMINPLGLEETKELIDFRIAQAGFKSEQGLFTDEAIKAIHKYTNGYLREVSLVCHLALENLVMQDKRIVDEEVIKSLIERQLEPLSISGGVPDGC